MAISRRTFVASTALLAGAATWLWKHPIPFHKRPNIIVVVADDLRYDALGYLGNPIISTPNLNALVDGQSLVFNNCFATTSICPVSRASILTGQYASRHKVFDYNTDLNVEHFRQSYPFLLRQNGYYTGFVGKWGVGRNLPQKAFDVWKGFAGQGEYIAKGAPLRHLTDIQTEQAMQFIDHAPREKPFLLMLSYKAPHVPLMPQKRFEHLYEHIAIPRARTDTKEQGALVPPALIQSDNRSTYDLAHFGDDKKYQEYIRRYYQLITGLDESVGKIMDLLLTRKQMEATLVIFVSDNGMLLGEHQLLGKSCMYEESIRIPLLIRLPKDFYPKPYRTSIDAMALNIDLTPTILEAAGITIPQVMQGRSLFALSGPDTDWREDFFYEERYTKNLKERITPCKGVRTKEWKYTLYRYFNSEQETLFNLQNDPAEERNLADNPQFLDIKNSMRQRMMNLEKQVV